MKKRELTEPELADYYDRTHDLSEFDEADEEPVQIKRSVTISVRFSAEEIEALRRRADAANMKVTGFIRAAALEAEHPIDREAVTALAAGVEAQIHQLRAAVS